MNQTRLLPTRLVDALSWAENKIKKLNREVQFSSIFVLCVLLLKIQTTITSSILGVRGSALDSREL